MIDFTKLTANQATNLIPDRLATWIKANALFQAGDHWQQGDGWSGPMLPSSNDGYATMAKNVEAAFVAQNAIGEIVERHVAGIIGDTPQKHVELTRPLMQDEEPTTEEEALLDQARALLSSWWSGKHGVRYDGNRTVLCDPHEAIQAAVNSLLLSKRGVLRLIIPTRLLQQDDSGETAVPIPASLEEAVNMIYVQHPDSANATVATDATTLDQAGIYSYRRDEQEHVEVVFINDNGRTVIRIASTNQDAAAMPGIDLGGRLTMHEMNRTLFITETVRRLQKALNLCITSGARNVITGGFLEREYFNTQMPGEFVPDETALGGQSFVPAKLNIGPNSANFLTGMPIYNDDGTISGYTTPQKHIHEPSSSEVFIQSAADYYQRILGEADQMHTIADTGSGLSGEFIIQARADFETSLKLTKTAVDAALTWCYDTVLTLAAVLAGQPDAFADLKVSGSAIVNTGPLSISERELIVNAYKERLLSRDTAVRLIGAENVSAEIGRINAEEDSNLSLKKLQAEIFKTLVDAQGNRQAAAELAGMDMAMATALTRPNRLLPQDVMGVATASPITPTATTGGG